ncbi:hypothetical protein LGL55_08310 [Clostridium tagluense]|uniref:hypothetical protein n=1 Tax=Clostridium tagluense TaxID=360422 RepID=UPI001CF0FE76|nr:hypothetical protein [Clostridium tagluense]MCB2311254.1 hypothetical protein [Clostridium tagluense]MCB2316104.1 hypothetical protein [Clostridium tagluense]MCB2320830.1 hypothetical protein [Clostridium tagluense]MCB2325973.1 hypothetical protein [Clostridium tagluense]MCB2330570.1 hypothetical protein [Clostridium tagluense]
MFKIAMSLIIIVSGITLILLGIYDPQKQIMKMKVQDKHILNKYIKRQKVLDVITGFSFAIVGVLSILTLITGEQVGLLSSLILLLNSVITFLFDKHVQRKDEFI